MKRSHSGLMALLLMATIHSCIPEPQEQAPVNQNADEYQSLKIPAGFSFEVSDKVTLSVTGVFADKSPIAGVVYAVYSGNPFEGGVKISQFLLDEQGKGSIDLVLAEDSKEIFLATNYLGLPPVKKVSVNRPITTVKIDAGVDSFETSEGTTTSSSNPGARVAALPAGFTALGTYNGNGLPSYLLTPDVIPSGLLSRINANLPEYQDIRKTNEDLLNPKYARQLQVNEDAEVWITFVHNGASWRNVLGYYYYEQGQKPKTPQEIKDKIIIFPHINALKAGNKVKLKGNLPNGAFKKGTEIGWFVISDGWKINDVTLGRSVIYSDRELNTFIPTPSLREQMVFLYDQQERLLLMSWEDMPRTGGDHDFNDVVFYAKWNPITSVAVENYDLLENKRVGDTDGDGVLDSQDEFPSDPDRAFTGYYPAKDQFGTFLFEDLWPSYGDYDLNDLVLGYSGKKILDAKGRIKGLDMSFVIRAIGAGVQNGFGIEFPTSPSNVQSVTGSRLTAGKINLNPNGTESGQQTAVVIVFDDANHKLPPLANVYNENSTLAEDTIKVSMVFKFAIDPGELGVDPFNGFLFRTADRGLEVHLMNTAPTTLASRAYFGSKDDRSNLSSKITYRSDKGLNWAMFLPEVVGYPTERTDFTKGYLKFRDWAESGGSVNIDWYKDKDGNLNRGALYKKIK